MCLADVELDIILDDKELTLELSKRSIDENIILYWMDGKTKYD